MKKCILSALSGAVLMFLLLAVITQRRYVKDIVVIIIDLRVHTDISAITG